MHTLSPQQLGFVSGGYCYDYDDDSYVSNEEGVVSLAISGIVKFIDSSIERPWLRITIKVGLAAVIVGLVITVGMNAMNSDDDC